jgi:hypothetical protein
MDHLRRIFFVTLLAISVGGRAFASPSSEARAYHEKAKSAFALEKYAQAAEYFERAFELKADPAILYNAALSHRLAGNKDRALALYQNYLRVFGHVGKWTEVEARVAELKTAIAEDQALAAPWEPRLPRRRRTTFARLLFSRPPHQVRRPCWSPSPPTTPTESRTRGPMADGSGWASVAPSPRSPGRSCWASC